MKLRPYTARKAYIVDHNGNVRKVLAYSTLGSAALASVDGLSRVAWRTGDSFPERKPCLRQSPFGIRFRALRSVYFRADLAADMEHRTLPIGHMRLHVRQIMTRAAIDAWITLKPKARESTL